MEMLNHHQRNGIDWCGSLEVHPIVQTHPHFNSTFERPGKKKGKKNIHTETKMSLISFVLLCPILSFFISFFFLPMSFLCVAPHQVLTMASRG